MVFIQFTNTYFHLNLFHWQSDYIQRISCRIVHRCNHTHRCKHIRLEATSIHLRWAPILLATPPCVHSSHRVFDASQITIGNWYEIYFWILLPFNFEESFFFVRLFAVDVCTILLPSTCCCLFKLLVSDITSAVDSVTRAHWGNRFACRAFVKGLLLLDISAHHIVEINWQQRCGWLNFDVIVILISLFA